MAIHRVSCFGAPLAVAANPSGALRGEPLGARQLPPQQPPLMPHIACTVSATDYANLLEAQAAGKISKNTKFYLTTARKQLFAYFKQVGLGEDLRLRQAIFNLEPEVCTFVCRLIVEDMLLPRCAATLVNNCQPELLAERSDVTRTSIEDVASFVFHRDWWNWAKEKTKNRNVAFIQDCLLRVKIKSVRAEVEQAAIEHTKGTPPPIPWTEELDHLVVNLRYGNDMNPWRIVFLLRPIIQDYSTMTDWSKMQDKLQAAAVAKRLTYLENIRSYRGMKGIGEQIRKTMPRLWKEVKYYQEVQNAKPSPFRTKFLNFLAKAGGCLGGAAVGAGIGFLCLGFAGLAAGAVLGLAVGIIIIIAIAMNKEDDSEVVKLADSRITFPSRLPDSIRQTIKLAARAAQAARMN